VPTPVRGWSLAVWCSASSAVHTTGFPPVHVPVWHVSVWVQALPSEQPVPFGAFGFVQTPVPGLHVPATWHASSAVHTTGFPPVKVEVRRVWVGVQALPSE